MVVRSAAVAALAEVIGADVLLDEALLIVLEPVDPQIVGAIVGICNDALVATLGPAIVDVIGNDPRLVLSVLESAFGQPTAAEGGVDLWFHLQALAAARQG